MPNANARKNEIITNVLKFYSSLSLLSYFLKDNKAIKKVLRSLPCAILNMLKLYQHISRLQAKNWYIKSYWNLLRDGRFKEKLDAMTMSIYDLSFMVSFQRHIFPKTQSVMKVHLTLHQKDDIPTLPQQLLLLNNSKIT